MTPQHTKTLVERDAAVLWHPYTQHKNMSPPLAIVRGSGVYLEDENDKRYIDAISSWWTNLHGHGHPHIAAAIARQALTLEHVIFAGCTHEPAVTLAERLLPLLPGHFSKVFYSDNGSTAVEVALKMAIQYQALKNGHGRRTKILALRNSYHGDTFGAMSVSERGIFTLAFDKFLFEVVFADPATGALPVPPGELLAFIYEPLVQGAGGMNIYDAGVLNDMLCRLKQEGVVLIADEVMTGFGRTGQLFASAYMHHTPDIICLSKGLTGGSLPLAITACTAAVFDAFLGDSSHHTFFHGHSYTANPIACAAGLASLDLLLQESCLDAIEHISARHRDMVQELQSIKRVKSPRSLGTILAFEFDSGKKEYTSSVKEAIIQQSLEQGIFLRPLGNTVYTMPPYCITDEELTKVYGLLRDIVGKL